jgi:hypothetical protein
VRATLLVAAGVARLPLRRLLVVDGAAALAVLSLAILAIVAAIVLDWRRRRSILTSAGRVSP